MRKGLYAIATVAALSTLGWAGNELYIYGVSRGENAERERIANEMVDLRRKVIDLTRYEYSQATKGRLLDFADTIELLTDALNEDNWERPVFEYTFSDERILMELLK